MDDMMLMDFLRTNDAHRMSEHEFARKFKEFMSRYDTGYNRSYSRNMHRDYDDWDYNRPVPTYDRTMMRHIREDDMYRGYPDYNRNSYYFSRHSMNKFTPEDAEYIVNSMYHLENGKKFAGQNYDMHKAEEVYNKYKSVIDSNVSIEDIYVAINAQYHDYSELFKSWFGKNIDNYIIESAITFWFKDTDYNKGHKLQNYFKED